jgi:RNA polymerase sigma factor (sigma-70 family)
MATAQMDVVIRHIRRTMIRQDDASGTDAHLLASFIHQKDEAAFAALARRHGPMVFGVCRRVIGNHHDAEDAFQAAFLVLARKASTIRPRERVANWLHGVALRTAMKAKAMTARRRGREKQVAEMPEPPMSQQGQWHDLQALLDQELNGLPENYRLPILLCDLESKTIKEAARQLGWPQGTVAGRLARGRKLLAPRLASRGVVLSAGALAAVVSDSVASANVPATLMNSTIKAAAMIAAGQVTATGVVSAKAAILTEGVLTSMFMTKLKAVSVSLLIIAALSGAAGMIYNTQAAQPPEAKQSKGAMAPAPMALDFAFPIAQQTPADTGKKDESAKNVAKPAAPKTDLEQLQGIWSVVSIEQGGKPAKLEKTVFMVDGKRACLQTDDGELQGGLYLDPASKPKTYDFVMSGRTIEGIYSLDGDTLRLCYNPATDAKRPLSFVTEKDSGQFLFVLKRFYGPEVFPFRLPDGTRVFPGISDLDMTPPPPPPLGPQPMGLHFNWPAAPPNDERKNKKIAEFYDRTGHAKTAEYYRQHPPGQEIKPTDTKQAQVPPAQAAGDREYVIIARLMEAGAGRPKEILGLPKVTVAEGQLAPIHIIDIPQNLLEKTIVEEKIKIGTFLDVRVKRLAGNKVRLTYSLECNQVDQSDVSEIRVLGNSLQGIQELELHKPTKIVFQKDAKGVAQRWLEITVEIPAISTDPLVGKDGKEKDPKVPDGRSHDFGKVKPNATLKHTFRIVNTSDDPLELTSIRLSGVGMTAALDKKILKPKEEAKLEVTIDARTFNGARTMWVFIDLDQRNDVGTFIFTVTANSENKGFDPEKSQGDQRGGGLELRGPGTPK